ncbi:MAG: ABC transporter substrate-binding protein [Vicinamibacterales bacterium]
MSVRARGVAVAVAVATALAVWPGTTEVRVGAAVPGPQASTSGPRRIVSLVPSATEALFAIGAGSQVIAVSSYDHFPPAVEQLPRVGALLDPDVERILALRPDLVITYGSQSALETQLARAGIGTYVYRHGGLDDALSAVARLGQETGHGTAAEALVRSFRARLDAVRRRVAGRARPRTLLVFSRQPRTLRQVYASGGVGFLHDGLEVAGATNVFADVRAESVQPSQETLLARAPEIILEVRPTGVAGGSREDLDPWRALASIPAVRNNRLYQLVGDGFVIPGPRLIDAVEDMARTIHPPTSR